MNATLATLHHYWDSLISDLPTLDSSHPTSAPVFSIIGIRLGYRVGGLLATYSIAPNSRHPRGGRRAPQDILDIPIPLEVTDHDLVWIMPSEREWETPHGKVTIHGDTGRLCENPPHLIIRSR